MLRRLRSHVRQNVVGYIALFFALGGSASAAFVVSSNSQIGPDTIYGASKPASANENIVAGSVGATDIAPGSVGTNKVIDNSLGAIDLGPNSVDTSELKDGAVTNSKIGSSVVDSSKVQNHSLTTADLDGTDHSGAISVSAIANGRCATLTGSVSGARPGDAVVVTTNGAIPSGVLIYGQRARTDAVDIKVCNLSGATSSAISDLSIRVLTIH